MYIKFFTLSTFYAKSSTIHTSDLRYILIPQYIDAVNEYCDMILHLEYRDIQNTLIEQSVIVLLEYISNAVISFTNLTYFTI